MHISCCFSTSTVRSYDSLRGSRRSLSSCPSFCCRNGDPSTLRQRTASTRCGAPLCDVRRSQTMGHYSTVAAHRGSRLGDDRSDRLAPRCNRVGAWITTIAFSAVNAWMTLNDWSQPHPSECISRLRCWTASSPVLAPVSTAVSPCSTSCSLEFEE